MTTLIPKFDFMNGGTTPTGAVNRTINQKLADTVSLFDFIPVSEQDALLAWTSTYDCTNAFLDAIAYLSGGGTLNIPPIRAMITAQIPLISGITIAGSSNVAHYYGAPTGNERPTYIWQATASQSVFTIAAGVSTVYHDIHIRDVALASGSTPPTVASNFAPSSTIDGLHMTANTPYNIHDIVLDRVTFYGFRRGISAEDLGTSTYTGNIGPVTLNNCEFYSNLYGVFLNDYDATGWLYNNCTFYVSPNGSGIELVSSGFFTCINCISGSWGGSNQTGTSWIRVDGSTVDQFKLINCQGEALDNFLYVTQPNGGNGYVSFVLDTCEIEAPITLAAECHYVSIATRYQQNVNVTGTNVKIDSYNDTWSASTFGYQITGSGSYINSAIVPATSQSASIKANTFLGKQVAYLSAIPSTGYWNQGDVVFNSTPANGTPSGWTCITGGTPGSWVATGQAGYRSGTASPSGVLTPFYVGEEYLNTSTSEWYKSTGLANTNWVALN